MSRTDVAAAQLLLFQKEKSFCDITSFCFKPIEIYSAWQICAVERHVVAAGVRAFIDERFHFFSEQIIYF